MIKSIYIMLENGVLLYSKNYIDVKYDNNLLIGFFASIINFSREALNTVVKHLDIGEDNKLILQPKSKEKIIAAAIVGSDDSDELIREILNNILLDFINEFPLYETNSENLDSAVIKNLITDNMRRKTFPTRIKLFIASVIILSPIIAFFLFISIYVTDVFQDLFLEVPLALTLYSSLTLLLMTLIPNIISGFLSADIRIAIINALIILVVEVTVYIVFVDRLFSQITLANLPITFILSMTSASFGLRMASHRYLKR